jgi:hypothetical protein
MEIIKVKEKRRTHLAHPPSSSLTPALHPIPNVIKIGNFFNEKCMEKRKTKALVHFGTISAHHVAAAYIDNCGT